MLKDFAYHSITVSDLNRSTDFYQNVMGMKAGETYQLQGEAFERLTGLQGAQAKAVMLDAFAGQVRLMEFLAPEGKRGFDRRLCDPGASHMSTPVDDVQKTYEHLRSSGVRFVAEPTAPRPERSERKVTFMFDPDGIVWEIHRGERHHEHVANDFEKSLSFYRDLLGMKVDMNLDISGEGISKVTGLPGAYLRSAHLVLDGGEFVELHQYLNPQPAKRPPLRLYDVGCSQVAFEVDDVRETYQRLSANGVRFVSEPVTDQSGHGVYMLDPDDYLLELRSK